MWFRRVVWLGIVANVALAVPTLIAPERMLALSGFPPATPLLWTRFAAWLLILLSLLYMPGGNGRVSVPRHGITVGVWRGSPACSFFATQAAVYRMLGGWISCSSFPKRFS